MSISHDFMLALSADQLQWIYYSLSFFSGAALMAFYLHHKHVANIAVTKERLGAAQQNQLELTEECEALEVSLESKLLRETELMRQVAQLEAQLTEERRTSEQTLQTWEKAEQHLVASFKALSGDVLRESHSSFLQLAQEKLTQQQAEAQHQLEQRQTAIQHLLQPVTESLSRVDEKLQHLENQRVGAYSELMTQMGQMMQTHQLLQKETSSLVGALRQPKARGQWGEMQLRRVAELSGMLEHCDFEMEVHAVREEQRLRPDMVVRLPGGKNLVVDAKTPLSAYLQAATLQEGSERDLLLQQHAKAVREHMRQLGQKSYFDQFQPSPEFVVLFLPGEMFFSAALEFDPTLIETGVDNRVILATPTTLIALLRSVAYGWRQEAMEQNAQQISQLGRELYDRIAKLSSHFSNLGKSIGQVVQSYNASLGALESRVLVTARKFKQLEGLSEEKSPLVQHDLLDQVPRLPQSPEFRENQEIVSRAFWADEPTR